MEKVLFAGTFADQAAAVAEVNRLQEEFIADCMRGAGFEYQPYIAEIDPDLLDSLREERARVEIGYGVATSLLVQLSFDPDAPVTGSVDPNDAIRESLLEAEQRAYGSALSDGPRSCYGRVHGAVDNPTEISTEMVEVFDDLSRKTESDGRVVAARQAWSACMAENGYNYRDRSAIEEEAVGRAEDLRVRVGEAIQARPGGSPSGADDSGLIEELQVLLDWETTRGRADLACSTDLTATLRIVQDQYEREWIEQNELLLAELISGS